jgi:predicted  nucleic acid-binding Zn-ribbon protein
MSDTDWKKKCQELENEMVLIKGITVTNSPELREANKKIKELEEGLANALAVNESHQKLNGRLQEQLTEVEEDNKKLAIQIDDSVNRMRKAGII